jgi:hypothetical protein
VERVRASIKGYWILPSGSLQITFYTPSAWERLVSWIVDDMTWVCRAESRTKP